MRLVSLNVWGGKIHDPLLKFIKEYKNKTDIFTFQEVMKFKNSIKTNSYYANILEEIADILSDFDYYFAPRAKGSDPDGKVNFPVEFGQATFIKKDIKKLKHKEIFVYKNFNIVKYFEEGHADFPSLVIQSIIEAGGKKIMILNFHGLWTPTPKHDTEHRLRQSQIIIDHIKYMNLPTILAGDFNLRIETKSLSMLEENGMQNLIKKFEAKTTRSSYYDEKWRKIDKYADYIFTSPGVQVIDFKVLDDEVSDHLPLFLEFKV